MSKISALSTKCRRRLQALQQLQSAAEIRLFCRIFVVALIAPHLAKWRLLPALRRRACCYGPTDSLTIQQVERIVALTDLALRVGYPLLQNRCLTRTLTLYYLLRRIGLMVDIQIGLASEAHGYAAHSWLVKDGLPFAERRDPRQHFITMYKIT